MVRKPRLAVELPYEQSAVFKQEIQPTLQPFFAGEYITYRCDVKYEE
jgi:hypothetical protein